MQRIKRLPKVYYIYALFDYNGIVRYVGKGKRRRMNDHERRCDKYNKAKKNFINKTKRIMGEIPKVKIREKLTEPQAFEIEIALIKAIGRIDLGTGPLTNMHEGGNGGGDYGHLIKLTKAKWTDEQRAKISKTNAEAMKNYWDSLSEEEYEEHLNKLITNSKIGQEQARQADPEYDLKRTQKIKEAHTKRTPEEKRDAADKALLTNPPERRSEITKQWHAERTPEERSATIKKGWDKLSPEEKSQRARGDNFDHEARSAQVRFQQANLTPEQQKRRAERCRNLARNTRWINNGIINKRLNKDEILPENWVYGKVPKKIN